MVVKKRSWELHQGAFESTGEQVKYLTPVPEVSKGHAVLTDRGFVKVVSYTIKDIKEPVKDQDELALVEVTADEDPLRLRRRLREKASVACFENSGRRGGRETKSQPLSSPVRRGTTHAGF